MSPLTLTLTLTLTLSLTRKTVSQVPPSNAKSPMETTPSGRVIDGRELRAKTYLPMWVRLLGTSTEIRDQHQ